MPFRFILFWYKIKTGKNDGIIYYLLILLLKVVKFETTLSFIISNV